MNQNTNKVYLYGLANVSDQYRIVAYSFIENDPMSIGGLRTHASWLKFKNPTVDHVYAIDDRYGLFYDYRNTLKRNTVESNVIFKCMLEKEGLRII